jgi:hypothetical protein
MHQRLPFTLGLDVFSIYALSKPYRLFLNLFPDSPDPDSHVYNVRKRSTVIPPFHLQRKP